MNNATHAATAAATIDVPADTAWATIADGGGVHLWFPDVIASSEIDGEGVGAARRCRMRDGAPLAERILEIDHGARRFVYAIDEHPLPATDVVATMTVTPAGAGASRIEWGASFEADDEAVPQVAGMLERIYATGIRNLAAFHGGAVRPAV